MNKLLVSAATALILSCGAAHAADLIIEEPLPVEASAYDWSGLYLGAHAGYLAGTVDVTEPDVPAAQVAPLALVEAASGDISGGIAGLYAGYNAQFDNVVVGIEGDFGVGAVSGNGVVVQPADDYSYDLNWNGHLRARAGFAADKFLVYAAGGLAFAGFTLSEGAFSDTQTHVGWTLGVGAEYAVTENIALRAEYLYDDLGTADYVLDGDPYEVALKTHTVRLGLSVSF
jgi:outer membrane immunogenic protein